MERAHGGGTPHGPSLQAHRLIQLREPAFGQATREICEAVVNGAERDEVLAKIAATIEPINVAGLADPAKRNWYTVDLDDLFGAAAKLDSTESEIREMLLREQLL